MPEPTSPPATIRVHAVIDGLTAGGAEALLAEFARAAPEAGIELRVTSLHVLEQAPVVDRLRELGVEPGSVRMPERLTPKVFRDLRRRLAAEPTDIVHTHLGAADLCGLTAARTLRLPAVSTIHSMEWTGTSRERLWMRMAAWARRHGDRVIAVSESAKRGYLAEGWDRPEHVTVVRNGIAPRPTPGAGRRIRAELGIDPGAPVIGMVSALRTGKGHDVAAAALQAVREYRPDARLVVVGEGNARGEIERQLEGQREAVLMTGHRDDVMELLDAFDIFVHPSRAEALPTTVMEAMAAGTPVVATDVGGISEVVTDGTNGTLIPSPRRADLLARAVLDLLDDPKHAAALARAARERVRSAFSTERWMRETRAVYESVIGAR